MPPDSPSTTPLKPLLVDVVAQAQHAGAVIGLVALVGLGHRAVDAAPATGLAPPLGHRHGLAQSRKLRADAAVGVEHERGAVEDELVLAAQHVEVDQRQAGLDHARDRDVEPVLGLAAPIGRAVRHQQNLAAGFAQAFDHLGAPDVLADRDADADALEQDRARHRPRREHALLVEHAVVRQIDLEANRLDDAAREQRIGVVELAVLDPGRADQDARARLALSRASASTAARQAAWNAGLSTRSSGG